MKTVLNILGVQLIIAGGIWFLQGVNVLPGSLMSGQRQWVINGGVAALVGIGLLIFANRRRASRPKE